MGNKAEKPLGIVAVHSPDKKSIEVDELEKLLTQLQIDLPVLQGPTDILNTSEKFLNYFIPLHKYKAAARIKDQENIIKKCEDIEKKCSVTLSNNTQRYALIGNQLKKHQIKDELELIKIGLHEITEDISKIEIILKRLEESQNPI